MKLSDLLVKSGAKYRKEMLHMPLVKLEPFLQHVTVRPGIMGTETVGGIKSEAELRPYKTDKGATDTTTIVARTLTTYLGDLVEEVDPYQLFETVYNESFDNQTRERTDAQIVKDMDLQIASTVSSKLGKALFKAKRNATGTKTMELFNGWDTIAAAEITAGNISADKGNYKEIDAITEANCGDILFSLYESAADELQDGENLKLFVPKTVKNLYEKWCLANFGAAVYNTSYNKSILHGTDENPVQIVGTSYLKGSDYIYLTSKSNMLVGCNQLGEKEQVSVRVPDNPKVVQFYMSLYWGVEFQMIEPEYLMVGKVKTTTA
jgi:hypothetical protein